MNDLHARERHIAEVLLRQGLTQLAAALGRNGATTHRHIVVAVLEDHRDVVGTTQMIDTRFERLERPSR